MGIRRSWSEVNQREADGNEDFLNRLARGVRTTSCTLWNGIPDWVTQNANLPASFIRGYMNDTCKNEPVGLPAGPTAPFMGGQCAGDGYQPECIWSTSSGTVVVPTSTFGLGPVSQITCTTSEQSPDSWIFTTVAKLISPSTGEETTLNGADNAISTSEPVLIEASPGKLGVGPDNCGDPPEQYPDSNFDPQTFSDTVEVPTQDGATLVFPIVLAPLNFNFPLNFDLGGIKVNLDLGGIEFNFGDINIGNDIQPLPDGQSHPLPAPQDDTLRNLCDQKLLPPDDSSPLNIPNPYNITIRNITDPKEETVSAKVRFVRITITGSPANASSSSGNGAPDVIFPGWFEWKSDDFVLTRMFINWDKSTFIAPRGTNGFAYTLQQGYEGFATIYETDV